jgi:hypothetical protein
MAKDNGNAVTKHVNDATEILVRPPAARGGSAGHLPSEPPRHRVRTPAPPPPFAPSHPPPRVAVTPASPGKPPPSSPPACWAAPAGPGSRCHRRAPGRARRRAGRVWGGNRPPDGRAARLAAGPAAPGCRAGRVRGRARPQCGPRPAAGRAAPGGRAGRARRQGGPRQAAGRARQLKRLLVLGQFGPALGSWAGRLTGVQPPFDLRSTAACCGRAGARGAFGLRPQPAAGERERMLGAGERENARCRSEREHACCS